MKDVYQQITSEFFNEFNTEIRRGKYPETRLNINWFDAIDAEENMVRDRARQSEKANSNDIEKRVWKAINDIP